MWEKDININEVREIRTRTCVYFGCGAINKIKEIAADFKAKDLDKVIVMSGKKAYKSTGAWDVVEKALKETFFKMDELMRTMEGKNELKELSKKSKIEDDEQEKRTGKARRRNPKKQCVAFRPYGCRQNIYCADTCKNDACTVCNRRCDNAYGSGICRRGC